MSKQEKFERNLEKAVAYAATEHNFFLELKKDLKELKEAVEIAKYETGLKGIKKTLHDINYWGRAERRFNKYYTHARILAKTLKEKAELPTEEKEKWDELIQELDVEAAHLIRDCSRYDGRLTQLFHHLDAVLQKKDFEQAQQVLMELEMTADDAEKWIEALAMDLKKAKKLAEDFSEVYHESIEGIKQVIAPLTPKAKTDYLIHLLKQWKGMKREIRQGVVALLDHYCDPSNPQPLADAATEMEKIKEWKLAAHLWELIFRKLGIPLEKAAEQYNPGYFIPSVAENRLASIFENAGNLKIAAEFYERGGIYYLIDNARHYVLDDWKTEELKNIKISLLKAITIFKKLGHDSDVERCVKKFIFACLYPPKIVSGLVIAEQPNFNMQIFLEREAVSGLRKALGWHKGDTLGMMGEVYNEQKDFVKAAIAYEKASRFKEAVLAWSKAAEYAHVNNPRLESKYKKEAYRVSNLLNRNESPQNKTQQRIQEANRLLNKKEFKKALKLFTKAKAWDRVADCYNQMGQGVLAIKFYKKAVQDFHEKFGLEKAKDLPVPLKLRAIIVKIDRANTNTELKKIMNEIYPLIKEGDDATVVIIHLQKVPVIEAEDWRFLAQYCESLHLPAHAAECYVHAGSIEDNKRAVEQYRNLKDKNLISAVSFVS